MGDDSREEGSPAEVWGAGLRLGPNGKANAHSLGAPGKSKRGKVVRAAFAGAGKDDVTVPGLKQ